MKTKGDQQKKASSTMLEGDRKLRTLVGNLPGIVFRCLGDTSRTMQFISDQCKEVTGHEPEQFYGKGHMTWAKLIHPMDLPLVLDTIAMAIEKESKYQVIYKINDSSGTIRWLNETGIPVNKTNGTVQLEGYIQDITPQIMASNTNAVMESTLNQVGNGIIISSAESDNFPILYVNNAFEKITGYGKEEVIGKNCNFLQKDDRQQEEIQIIKEALTKKKGCQVELRNYRKDGRMFWNELTLAPISNGQGDITHFVGVQNDITDRKNLELIRETKNEVLEMIIKKSSLQDIFDHVREFLERQLNIETVIIFRFDDKRHTLLRASPKDTDPELAPVLDKVIASSELCPCMQALSTKQVVFVENIALVPPWSQHKEILVKHRIQSCCSHPILDSDRQVLGVLTTFCPNTYQMEVQKRKLVDEMAQLLGLAMEQNNLREELEKWQRQLEARSKGLEIQVEQSSYDLKKTLMELDVANFELVAQTNETKEAERRVQLHEEILLIIAQKFPKGAILLVNKQGGIEFMEGDELKGLQEQLNDNNAIKIKELNGVSHETGRVLKKNILKTLHGEHLSFEVDFQEKDYLVNTTPLYIEGPEVSHALLVLFNISERKRNEDKIIQNLLKEKELSELKTQFINTASHEFRAPLSVILSSAFLIGKLSGPEQGEKRLAHLEKIKVHVRQLVNVLNDFLSASKLEDGKVKIAPEPFDLLPYIEDVLAEMGASTKKDQQIEWRSESVKIGVYQDPKLLRLILINLVGNAIKYSAEGQPIWVDITDGDPEVTIMVIDRGIGVPVQDQPHLFRRFFRARNSINISGTGLGLHIVKFYVELMGGNIAFDSKEDEGSSFTIRFPKIYQDEEADIGNRRS